MIIMSKVYIAGRIPKNLVEWVDKMVEKRIFANRSHAIEYAIAYLQSVYEREGRLPPIE